MSGARAHVVGAGLAGLAAAVALVRAGFRVTLSDAAAQPGGRCRSYHDPRLGQVIDNGNHLVLSGNAAVARFRATIDAREPLAGPAHADYPFADLRSGERWTVAINDGAVPWWTLSARRRVPGTRLRDYLGLARLLRADGGRVGDHIACTGPLWERLLEPVLLAALNTAPADASAALAGAVLRETVAKGGRAMRPRIAEPSLGAAFVDPAIGWLRANGATLALGRRLRGIERAGDHVTALAFADGTDPVGADEPVILAVPAWIAADLVPGLVVPDAHRAIVNGHFACPAPPGAPPILGLLGGTAEWLFAFPTRLSITVSAADAIVDIDREELARIFWADIGRALGTDAPLPAWQIVKEKRATFAATPEQEARRPQPRTALANLLLAGDWTATGLPATIEGAIRSGETAARLAGEARG